MGPKIPFSKKNSISQKAVIRLAMLVVSLLLLITLMSCGEVSTTSQPNPTNPSTNLTFTGVGDDQRSILNEINSAQPSVSLEAVSGQVSPSTNLRPLFQGSSRVEMKILFITPNGDPTAVDLSNARFDPTLFAFTQFAGNIGIPYDVMVASQEELTEAKLVAANGDGLYQAIILTDNGLGLNSDGTTNSAFDQTEWNLLWQYQREFNVRQVSLQTIPGTFPEDLGLRLFDSISTTPTLSQNISITTEGEAVFGSLKASSIIPVSDAVMNLTDYCGEESTISCPEGVTTTPILRTVSEDKVIATVSNTNDGREVLSLMTGHTYFANHSALLSYDIFKWVTQGVFLGAREMYLQIDVDDWFQKSLLWDPATNTNSGEVFAISGFDVITANAQLDELKSRFPMIADFKYTNAVVASKGDGAAISNCTETATLSEASICLKDAFDWVNHTYTERAMNFESPGYNNAADILYNTEDPELNGLILGYTCDDSILADFTPATIAEELVFKEVMCNVDKLQQMGITIDTQSVITSAHSGLGIYNPDPTNPVFIENGLGNSSPGTLGGMIAANIRYMGSNYSAKSHRGVCDSCGRQHPLFPEIFLIPRFPTLMFFNATNPTLIESEFNFLFGPNSATPASTTNLSFQQVLQLDVKTTLQHIAGAQPYMHFFHQANFDNYTNGNPGRSLIYDWLEGFLTYYTSFYDLPLLTMSWADQAANIEQRTSYYLSGTKGIWDRATGEVTLTSSNGGAVYVSNAEFANATTSTYGADTLQKFELAAGQSVSGLTTIVTPAPSVPLTSNLLVNGSFENRQAAWSTCGAGATRLIQVASDGENAIKLSGQAGGCLYQEVAIVPGSDYALSCDVQRRNSARWSSLALKFNDANYTNEVDGDLKEITGSQYSDLTLSATAPANAEIAVVVLFSEDTAFIDNCVLTGAVRTNPGRPTPVETNLLVNGGFENSLNGWENCSSSNNSLVAIDPDVVSGVGSLELDDGGCLYQDVAISGGQNLRLSCFAKSSTNAAYTSMTMTISSANYASELLTKEVEVLAQSYDSVELNVTAPSAGAIASVSFYSEDYANFDDCVLITE